MAANFTGDFLVYVGLTSSMLRPTSLSICLEVNFPLASSAAETDAIARLEEMARG